MNQLSGAMHDAADIDTPPQNDSLSASEESAIMELFEEANDTEGFESEVQSELNELFSIRDVSDNGGDTMLDDLLQESMQAKKEADLAKQARQRLHTKDSKLGRTEKEELQSAIRAYEAKREWYAQADVALFNTQICTYCGGHHSHFAGFYQRQISRFSSVERWVRATPEQNKNLPKETRTDISYINMCGLCKHEFGYPNPT